MNISTTDGTFKAVSILLSSGGAPLQLCHCNRVIEAVVNNLFYLRVTSNSVGAHKNSKSTKAVTRSEDILFNCLKSKTATKNCARQMARKSDY